jgi:hypothetical protein
VSEQHFDLFALAARGLVGFGFGDVAGEITRTFMDSGHFWGLLSVISYGRRNPVIGKPQVFSRKS